MTRARAKSYKHIIKYTGVFGSVEVLKILIGLIRNKVVALILGPDGMGLMSLFVTTIKFFSDSTNLGIPTSAVREIAAKAESGDNAQLAETVSVVRTLSLFTAIMGTLMCALLGPLLNRWTFTWGDHTLHFILLSPAVGITALLGGELAILKGLKQLRSLARQSVYSAVASLIVAVPLFYLWGMSAIVTVLLLTELSQLLLVANFSYRIVAPRFTVLRKMWHESKVMITLGVAFVVSGIFVSGSDFLIRTYLNNVASLETVGLFSAGYVIVSVYGGMVFSAMETDYYPRISSISTYGRELNLSVNEQIEVSLVLIAPMLVVLMVFMPIIIPLLYSNAFMPVVPMIQVCLIALFFRAVYMPLEYISLAKARSRLFLIQEIVSTLLLITGIIGGYHIGELIGAGVGFVAAYMLESILVMLIAGHYYHYQPSRRATRYFIIELGIGVATYIITLTLQSWAYWVAGTLMCLICAGYSLMVMRRSNSLPAKLRFLKK